MKTVIYKNNGVYYITDAGNYKRIIQDASKIQKMDGFNSAEEIIEYLCTYSKAEPDDLIAVDKEYWLKKTKEYIAENYTLSSERIEQVSNEIIEHYFKYVQLPSFAEILNFVRWELDQ
jgi:hypothetical protein